MDGRLALWYSRTRKTTSVFDREARQQQVLEAIWSKARAGGLLEMIPTIYEQYGQSVETDLGWGNILMLGALAARMELSQVTLYNIGWSEVIPYVTMQGGNVYLPNWERMAEVIDRALAAAPATGRRFVVVEGMHGMDGDRAPLQDLAEVCRRRGALSNIESGGDASRPTDNRAAIHRTPARTVSGS